jgi:hypothetical protein
MTAITNNITEDQYGKPGIGVYDPTSHTMVTAQAGTVVTDSNGVQYAPIATSGSSGSTDVAVHDNGTPANHLAIDGTGKIGVSSLPALPTGTNTIGGAQIVDSGGTNKLAVDGAGKIGVSSLPALPTGTNAIGSVQLLDSGGTNKAAIDAGGNVATKGGYTEQASLSAGSLNADLVPSTDVSAYKWFSLHTSGTWSGLFTLQCSNDNTNWISLNSFVANNGATFSNTFTTNNLFHGPIFFRYLRVRMTSYTSGTANGTLELYTSDAMAGINTVALNGGTSTIGAINNDGTSSTAIAAGTSANTVVKASGGRLASILVTTTGTNALTVYDNASTNSGTILAVIPANAAAGTFTVFKVPAANGITVAGNASNPAVSIFYV